MRPDAPGFPERSAGGVQRAGEKRAGPLDRASGFRPGKNGNALSTKEIIKPIYFCLVHGILFSKSFAQLNMIFGQ
ncbi:MAG: hypothetical protein LC660_13530 [Desulfobacteraceae bacterium]|nr:hypothetical protein [Desulfobacteraceae bacterium]